jgi:hypothetical protein
MSTGGFVPERPTGGEALAWERLAALDPADVCLRTRAQSGGSPGRYVLKSFEQEIVISVPDRSMSSRSEVGRILLEDLARLSRVSILRYLIHARDLPLADALVTPIALPGGEIYARGTHVLPLARIAQMYAHDPERFLRKCRRLGGCQVNQGSASLRLFPFPRVPVVLTVWAGDEEFPPECVLLFDAGCTQQLPLDILWSTAMLTTEAILAEGL